jgi:hypothetical protein
MTSSKLSLGDRYADWAVVIVTILALLAGWLYMGSVESRSLPFDANGLRAAVPAGWIQSEPAGNVLLQTQARASIGFQTTYMISKQLMTADGGMNEAVSLLTLKNGQELTAYRVLDQRKVSVSGRDAYEITYAYVEADPNVTHAGLPVVVLGADYIFFNSEGAVIVTYRASEAEYEGGLTRFHRFLSSIQF